MSWVTKTAVFVGCLLLSFFALNSNVTAKNLNNQTMFVSNESGCDVNSEILLMFPDEFIRSDDRTGKPDRGGHYLRIDTYIPSGEYDVILHSYDDHGPDNQHPEQTHEQWHLIFRSGEDVVATSNSISDLPDSWNTISEKVNTALSLSKDVDNVLAHHSFYLDPIEGKNINSIHPRCAGLSISTPVVASIGDRVWYDDNKNGLQDFFETGVSGVTVHLYDEYGFWIRSTETNANGNYHFTGLNPGTYAIQVDPPEGFVITGQNLGDEFLDSDIDSNGRMAFTTLTDFENDLSWDAGIYQGPNIPAPTDVHTNKVSIICSDDQVALPEVMLTLMYDGIPLEDRNPDFNGKVEFTPIFSVGTERMGYFNSWNFTTSYDPYLLSVRVKLPTRTIIVTPDLTKDDIFDWFIELPFNECAKIENAAIGDFVWLDWNQNDIQDRGENGVAGVVVILYDSNNQEVSRAVTNDNGRYIFGDLQAGDYSLQFIPPPGYSVVVPNIGSSIALDSDVNLVDFRTPMTTLEPFEQDMTWDAGLFTPNKLPACARFNLDLGRNAQTGAGVKGTYTMIEIGTGSMLASWEAEDWWVDSGWIRDIDLAHPEGSWVEVYFYPEGSTAGVKLEIINPAPGTPYGWLAPGICHAIEVQFPADWDPNGAS